VSRPRDPEVDRAILAATAELVAESGFEALTVDAVAERAGVARASIYRRHANRTALLIAACEAFAPPLPEPPRTGSLRCDLLALGTAIAGALQDRATGGLLPTMIAASSAHPEMRDALATFFSSRRSPTAEAVREAIERGEVEAEVDPELVADLLVGAVVHRTVLRAGRVGPTRVAQLVDVVLGGITARN
jgi:AcrR family transcriptional regulator